MSEQRNESDRRSDRRHAVGGRIFWRRPGRNMAYLGWLSDASASSASFITADTVRPAVGEQVELTDFKRSKKCC